MKKLFFIALLWVAVCLNVKAQFDTQVSNYWAIPAYYNPAYAGQSGNLEATLLSRMQWIGINNAPRSTIITAEMPLQFMGRIHGVGATVYSDRIGLFSSTVISGQYAWKKKIGKGDLSIGIQGGYLQQSFDGTKVEIEVPGSDAHTGTDEAIPQTLVSGSSIDASFGIYYSTPKWYAGLSVTHLLGSEMDLNIEDSESSSGYYVEVPRSYYFTAGYNIQLNNPLLELRPSILLKTMEMSSLYLEPDSLIEKVEENLALAMMRNTQLDVSLRLFYKKQFWGGFTWRKDDAVILTLGAKFKMIEVGYAYDFPTSRILKESSGSHEIYARYVFDLNLRKGERRRHKSVRIL